MASPRSRSSQGKGADSLPTAPQSAGSIVASANNRAPRAIEVLILDAGYFRCRDNAKARVLACLGAIAAENWCIAMVFALRHWGNFA